MNKQILKSQSWSILVIILLVFCFAFSLSAQKNGSVTLMPLAEDTFINPHDSNNEFYAENGVVAKTIFGRRTGYDFLSVISFSSNPIHRNVRVLATLPAYGADGEMLFWTPLGELRDEGFTDDGAGFMAREIANTFPIYVFPSATITNDIFSFTNSRQAAIINERQTAFYDKGNPLGLRL